MSLALWRSAGQVIGCFAQAHHLLSLHARGRLDADALAAQLQAIEARVAELRQRHGLLDVLVILLGQPVVLPRAVGWLLLLVGLSVLARCR